MINAIVFDIGGVILRTEDRTKRQELESKFGLQPGNVDQLVFNNPKSRASTLGKALPQDIWQYIAKTLSLSPDGLENFKRDFWSGDRVDRSIIQFLQTYRKDYKTALLSNAWVNARSIFAETYGLIEGLTVDLMLISSELGVAKPNHRIYQILSEKLKSEFNEILFVDDFIENIEAAKLLGIHVIHYQPGMNLIKQLKSMLE